MATSMCRFRLVFSRIINANFQKRSFCRNSSLSTYTVQSYNLSKVLNHKHFYFELAPKCQVLLSCNSVPARRFFCTNKKLSSEEISEKVLNVCKIFDKIPSDKLTLESHFMNDLGLDSLDHVELIMNIEDDFNFEIPDADAEKLLRPRDIVAYIEQKEGISKK